MLQVEPLGPLGRHLERARDILIEYLPNLLAAIALLAVGWLLARLLRFGVTRLIARFYRLLPGQAFRRELKESGMERFGAELIGGFVYWVVFLFFFAAATETLGLPVISTLLGGLARYLPNVLAAVLIVVTGVVLARLARAAVAAAAGSAGLAYGDVLGRTAQIVLLLIAVVIAVDQIGVDSTFLMLTLAIVMGALVSGAALAFGLGARTTVSNLLASNYLLQNYQVGQRVRIGEIEGRIVEINSTGVVLETAAGRAQVPAKLFGESVVVVLAD